MSSQSFRNRSTGIFLVLVSTLGFSAKSIFAKLAYNLGCDALTLVFWRMLLSLPFFLLAILWSQQDRQQPTLHRQDWLQIGLLGIAGYYLSSILDFEGLMFISASLERLTLFLYPTLVLLLDWIFHHRPLQRRSLYALLLSYLGISLVVTHDLWHSHGSPTILVGTLLVLLSSLSYACYLLGSQPLIRRLGSTRFTGLTLSVASITVVVHGLAQQGIPILHLRMPVFELAVATSLISTVMPVFLLTAGIARIGSPEAALIGSAGPVATLILGLGFLHENITGLQFLGALLVITGVLFSSTRQNAEVTASTTDAL